MDTSAWYALADSADRYHEQAIRILQGSRQRRQQLVTTNHVVGECYTLFRSRGGFSAAQRFLERLRVSPAAERIFVPDLWEVEAEKLLSQYADQDISYVDATSFVTMRHSALTTAFAFDHHFAVAGFSLLSV